MKAADRPRVDGLKIHWDWEMESREADNLQHCYVTARVSHPNDDSGRRLETFSSSGLGGIDPAFGATERREFEDEQLADLRVHLEFFGIEVRQAQWDRLIQEARS